MTVRTSGNIEIVYLLHILAILIKKSQSITDGSSFKLLSPNVVFECNVLLFFVWKCCGVRIRNKWIKTRVDNTFSLNISPPSHSEIESHDTKAGNCELWRCLVTWLYNGGNKPENIIRVQQENKSVHSSSYNWWHKPSIPYRSH